MRFSWGRDSAARWPRPAHDSSLPGPACTANLRGSHAHPCAAWPPPHSSPPPAHTLAAPPAAPNGQPVDASEGPQPRLFLAPFGPAADDAPACGGSVAADAPALICLYGAHPGARAPPCYSVASAAPAVAAQRRRLQQQHGAAVTALQLTLQRQRQQQQCGVSGACGGACRDDGNLDAQLPRPAPPRQQQQAHAAAARRGSAHPPPPPRRRDSPAHLTSVNAAAAAAAAVVADDEAQRSAWQHATASIPLFCPRSVQAPACSLKSFNGGCGAAGRQAFIFGTSSSHGSLPPLPPLPSALAPPPPMPIQALPAAVTITHGACAPVQSPADRYGSKGAADAWCAAEGQGSCTSSAIAWQSSPQQLGGSQGLPAPFAAAEGWSDYGGTEEEEGSGDGGSSAWRPAAPCTSACSITAPAVTSCCCSGAAAPQHRPQASPQARLLCASVSLYTDCCSPEALCAANAILSRATLPGAHGFDCDGGALPTNPLITITLPPPTHQLGCLAFANGAGGVAFSPVDPSSFEFQVGAAWRFPAFAIALGCSYFQRLLRALPHLASAAARCPALSGLCHAPSHGASVQPALGQVGYLCRGQDLALD
jgi:hypothetical protein